MAGLLGNIYIALFHDKSGRFVGYKNIKWTSRALKLKSFTYDKGTYLIDSLKPFSFYQSFFPLFQYRFLNYEIGNPNPLSVKDSSFKTEFNASMFNTILESDALIKLNQVRNKGFLGFLTLKNIIILVIIVGLIIFFTSGGDINQVGSQVATGLRDLNRPA